MCIERLVSKRPFEDRHAVKQSKRRRCVPQTGNGFHNIPRELLAHILGFLHFPQMQQLSIANQWMWKNIFNVKLSKKGVEWSVPQTKNAASQALLPSILKMQLLLNQSVDSSLSLYAYERWLFMCAKLDIPISYAGFRHVTFHYTPQLNDIALEFIGRLTDLQTLRLSSSKITDNGLQHLSQLTGLEHLSLIGCENITSYGLSKLATLSQLESLNFTGCRLLTNSKVWEQFKNSPLQHINIAHCEWLSDQSVLQISVIATLRALILTGCKLVTDASVSALANLPNLRKLSLQSCPNITDASLLALKVLRFKVLDVRWCIKITDVGITSICLERLERLYFSGCGLITDASMKHLLSAPLLNRVALIDCPRISITEWRNLKYSPRRPVLRFGYSSLR